MLLTLYVTCLLIFGSDLKIILDEEACNAPEKGWKFVKKSDNGDEVWRKSVESSSVNLVKVSSHSEPVMSR